jgi:hypothetical protein
VALDQATDRDEATALTLHLHAGCFEDHLDRLLLRGIDEPTCVHQDDLGRRQVIHAASALPDQLTEHSLGVDGVLVAAQANETKTHRLA